MLPLEIVEPHCSPARGERAAYLAKARDLLALVGLQGFEDQFPWQLSGGMQQRTSLCRALIHDPSLLMLDEPFASLDMFTREELWLALQDLWIARRPTVILVTHDLREAVFLADRVLVMSARPGRIIAERAVDLPRPRKLDTTYEPYSVALVQELREHISAARVERQPDARIRLAVTTDMLDDAPPVRAAQAVPAAAQDAAPQSCPGWSSSAFSRSGRSSCVPSGSSSSSCRRRRRSSRPDGSGASRSSINAWQTLMTTAIGFCIAVALGLLRRHRDRLIDVGVRQLLSGADRLQLHPESRGGSDPGDLVRRRHRSRDHHGLPDRLLSDPGERRRPGSQRSSRSCRTCCARWAPAGGR